MKLMKLLFTVMLVSAIAFSCKSEKKEAGEAVDAAVEETTEAASEAVDAVEEGAEAASEAASEAVETVEEAVEASTEKRITVIFPKDTKLQNETKELSKQLVDGNPEMDAYFHKAYGFAVFPKITKFGYGKTIEANTKVNADNVNFRQNNFFGRNPVHHLLIK